MLGHDPFRVGTLRRALAHGDGRLATSGQHAFVAGDEFVGGASPLDALTATEEQEPRDDSDELLAHRVSMSGQPHRP